MVPLQGMPITNNVIFRILKKKTFQSTEIRPFNGRICFIFRVQKKELPI